MNLWTNREFAPMLLGESDTPFNDSQYLYELKFDGTRALIFVNQKEIQIKNRRGHDITGLYPELNTIKELVSKNTILDGEIIAIENGLPSFEKLQSRLHLKNKSKILHYSQRNPVIFICFDILYDGVDCTNEPLINRKNRLKKIPENDALLKVKYIDAKGTELYENIQKLHLEGIVAKKKDSIYEINKRTSSWLKIKNLKKDKFYICGYIESKNNATVSLALGEKKGDKFYYVGKVVMTKKNNLYTKIKKQKVKKVSSFIDYKEEINYIKPIYQCLVEYLEKTANNHLRQPVFRD